jgi:predicted O-methyltransferase YrrM
MLILLLKKTILFIGVFSKIKNMDIFTALQESYLDSLHPPLSETMKELKAIAKKMEVPIVGDEVGRLLCLLTFLKQPRKILELGTGISYSTHWMLLKNPNCSITTIDQNKDRIAIAKKFLKKSCFLEKVKLLPMWIEDFFSTNEEKFDLIFLDSQKSLYEKNFTDILMRLENNGLLVVDNNLYKKRVLLPIKEVDKKYQNAVISIKKFNQLAAKSCSLESFFFSLGDGVLVATKKTK